MLAKPPPTTGPSCGLGTLSESPFEQRRPEPLASQVMGEFAKEASLLAPDLHLALSFDDGQLLSDDDLRQLHDLASQLPPQVHLRVAFATDTLERVRTVNRFVADTVGLEHIEVPPLAVGDVENWLSDEGLAVGLAPAVIDDTDGYPLLIEAAIQTLKQGGSLSDHPSHEQFARSTRAAWDSLSAESAAVARRLCVLRTPPTQEVVRQIARIDDAGAWATVVAELRDSQIFTTVKNGRLWFHGDRRRLVLNEYLTPEQRSEVALAAAEYLWPLIERPVGCDLDQPVERGRRVGDRWMGGSDASRGAATRCG